MKKEILFLCMACWAVGFLWIFPTERVGAEDLSPYGQEAQSEDEIIKEQLNESGLNGLLSLVPEEGQEFFDGGFDQHSVEKLTPQNFFSYIWQKVKDKASEMCIRDRVGAYAGGYIDREAVLQFLRQKPPALEVVLTGRNPAPELIELSDYLTEMQKRKHPMDEGIPARLGIEL